MIVAKGVWNQMQHLLIFHTIDLCEAKAQPRHMASCASNSTWTKMSTNIKLTATAMPHMSVRPRMCGHVN